MSAVAKPMLVGWKVSALSANIASVRYRALLPIVALDAGGVRSRIFASGLEKNLDGLDVLVIVKSFKADDLRLAQTAAARGIIVIYDLCDNIFIEEYAPKNRVMTPAQMFLSIARYATCIVATTEPLAAEIRKHVEDKPVVVIPDGIESTALVKPMARFIREAAARQKSERFQLMAARVGNALRRVRVEGVRVVPSLMGYAARRVRAGLAHGLGRRKTHKPAAVPAPVAHAASMPAPLSQAAPLTAQEGTSLIVWFGNHGAEHARFGMLDILEFREALETIAREHEVELVVISNNREKYETSIQPLAIRSRYVDWSSKQVDQWLKVAAAVIVPNTLDPFSLCKSANRTVLALAHGVPVIATMTPALHPLGEFIQGGDPLEGLRVALGRPEEARRQALDGYRHAEALFGLKAIRSQWQQLLQELPEGTMGDGLAQPYLAVVLHLVQDLDLALPVLREARQAGVAAEAWCSTAVFQKSRRVHEILKAEGIPFRMLPEEDSLARYVFPTRTRALLTVAESNLGPHRVPRLLAEAAVRQGLLVATLQHGYENIGLTFDDHIQSIEKVNFAAQRIYLWGPLHTLHSKVSTGVRVRCVPIGCPKDAVPEAADLAGLIPEDSPVIGIFENLHWHRYDDRYRQGFLDSVTALAQAFPQVVFVVKPHHAGLWLTKRYDGTRPDAANLVIADPQAPEWERHTAPALMGRMQAVITTPSTVALDAARRPLPVAVVAGNLALENYHPLPLLNGAQDWIAFVEQVLDPERRQSLVEQSARFVDAVITPGNAARRIVEDLRMTAGA